MEYEYYIEDDGTIHRRRRPGRSNGARNGRRRQSVYHASAGRKAAFWIFTVLAASVIGVLLGMAGDEFSVTEVIGALAGSIAYGSLGAEDEEYNLLAFVFAAIAAVCGAFVFSIAVWLIGIVAAIAKFALKAILIIFLIILFLGGL